MAIGITGFNQIRDINGFLSSTLSGRPVSELNQVFTLSAGTATTGTAPASSANSYTAVITISPDCDVYYLDAATPDLDGILPSDTVTDVPYQQINNGFITTMTPGQAWQFCYNSTPITGYAPVVHIAYYANITNNSLI